MLTVSVDAIHLTQHHRSALLFLPHALPPPAERKLRPNEQPHALYIQNYSTATSSCLCVRRWLFSVRAEQRLCQQDPQALSFFYWEAVQAVNRGHLTVGERLYELKALQEQTKQQEVGRAPPGDGEVGGTDAGPGIALSLVVMGW